MLFGWNIPNRRLLVTSVGVAPQYYVVYSRLLIGQKINWVNFVRNGVVAKLLIPHSDFSLYGFIGGGRISRSNYCFLHRHFPAPRRIRTLRVYGLLVFIRNGGDWQLKRLCK